MFSVRVAMIECVSGAQIQQKTTNYLGQWGVDNMGWILRIGTALVSGLIVLSLSLQIAYGADCDTSLLNRSVSNALYSPDSQTVLINRGRGLFAEAWAIAG